MVTVKEYHDHIFSKEFRVAYYCGNLQHTHINACSTDIHTKVDIPFLLNYNLLFLLVSRNNSYYTDLFNYFEPIKDVINKTQYVYFIIGDYISEKHPVCLRKTRIAYYKGNGKIELPKPMCACNGILLKLNTPRHWSPIYSVNQNDIVFHKKYNKLIWRGSSTGTRPSIIESLQNHPNKNIDIKFVNICYNVDKSKFIIAPRISMAQLLEYKFILSIEGNDIASDLKWLLYSNSVVFMCRPTKCSWAMEDLLIPFVHYILIKDDYSDLEEKYIWALNNLETCNEIAQNGKAFIQHFLDGDNEMNITKHIILQYMKLVDIRIIQ